MKISTKALFIYGTLALAIVGLGVIAACANKSSEPSPSRGESRPLKITKHYILIPGTAIAEKDQEHIEAILKKYEGSLYRVHLYKDGKKKKTWGELSDMEIGETKVAEIEKFAQTHGLSAWTTRIGLTCNSHRCSQPSATPTPTPKSGLSCNTTCNPKQSSDALVKAITPILEKYSK